MSVSKTPLRLYSYDQGWAGAVVVVARNKTDALAMMKPYLGEEWGSEDSINEDTIEPGVILVFLGDQ